MSPPRCCLLRSPSINAADLGCPVCNTVSDFLVALACSASARLRGRCHIFSPGPPTALVRPVQQTLVAKQARRQSAVRTAAAKAMASADASGYGSDEEVYATAKAVDDADGYDERELESVDKKKIEPLVALDHANMEYDDFVKDFYEEPPALGAMSFPEVKSKTPALPRF